VKTLIAIASIALTLASSTAAHAADEVAPTLTVNFADLNLNKPQGAAILFARIRMAARTVCEELRAAGAKESARYKACVQVAISNAVTHVDRPELTEYIAGLSGKTAKAPERLASQR
jgi:UrcA family protein